MKRKKKKKALWLDCNKPSPFTGVFSWCHISMGMVWKHNPRALIFSPNYSLLVSLLFQPTLSHCPLLLSWTCSTPRFLLYFVHPSATNKWHMLLIKADFVSELSPQGNKISQTEHTHTHTHACVHTHTCMNQLYSHLGKIIPVVSDNIYWFRKLNQRKDLSVDLNTITFSLNHLSNTLAYFSLDNFHNNGCRVRSQTCALTCLLTGGKRLNRVNFPAQILTYTA